MSPLTDAWVSVRRAPHRACFLATSTAVSRGAAASAAAGVFLYLAGPSLAARRGFRLSAFAAAFASASLLVLCVLLIKALPGRRVAALMTLFGAASTALWTGLVSALLPNLDNITSSPVVQGYVAVSLVVGAGLAAWGERAAGGAEAVADGVAVCVQCAGLALLLFSAADLRIGALLCLALAAADALPGVVAPVVRAALARRLVARAAAAAARAVASPPPSPPRHASPPARSFSFHARASAAGSDGDGACTPPHVAAATPARPASAAAPSPSPSPQPASSPSLTEHPLVVSGLVLNVATKRNVKLDGAVCARLLKDGAVLDRVAGTITPPKPGRRG